VNVTRSSAKADKPARRV